MSTATPHRTSELPVDSLFVGRWSPRAFTGESLSRETLLTFIEAARWAPSAYNAQPWRFIYALKGGADWERFLGLLLERNQAWAKNASALVFIVSKESLVPPGKSEAQPNGSHSFDAGAAWASFAFQASLSGWQTHGIGGFDRDRALTELRIPEGYTLEAGIAVGRRGDPAALPDWARAIEAPNGRKPLTEIAAEGTFTFA